MAKENERQTLREYGNRKKRYKRIRRIIILILLLIMAVIGVLYVVNLYNKSYQNYKVIKTIDIKGETEVGFLSYGSSVIKYGKDGAQAYDKDGNQLWNGSYEMLDPIADTSDKFAVFADKGGKSVHIFNDKGEVGSYSTMYDITKIEVASQGVVAALMEEGDTNHIVLYNLDGSVLWDFAKSVKKIGYPLDISLSSDGKKLVLNCLTITEGKLACQVGFYNFGEVGQNHPDEFVGGWSSNNGILTPKSAFLNNDTICVYNDAGFVLYSMKEIPKVIKEVKLEGKIQSVLYTNKYTGVVLETEDASYGRLLIYNLKGKKILDKTLDFEYKNIYFANEEIIMYDDLNCIVMKVNGKIKFKGTFDGNISGFYPINNFDRYFLAGTTKLSDIQLTE